MIYGEIKIEIDDIIGNAFINSLERKEKRILEIKKIDQYAIKVVEQLNANGKKARLNLSREADEDFFHQYSHWFKRIQKDNKTIIVLEDNVTIMELYRKFATSLSIDLLSVFGNYQNVQVLF